MKALERISGNQSALARRRAKARTARSMSGGISYLSLNRDGDWALGEDGHEVCGEVVVIDPTSLEEGYMAYTDSGNQYQMANVDDETEIEADSLPSLDGVFFKKRPAEWQKCRSLKGAIITGPQKGTVFRYTPTSVGGISAWGDITGWSTDQLDAQANEQERLGDPSIRLPQYMLLHLGASWYWHKTWDLITNPLFTLVSWASTPGIKAGDIDLEALHAAVEESRAVGLKTLKEAVSKAPDKKKPKFDPVAVVDAMVSNHLLEGYEAPKEVVKAELIDDANVIVEEAELPKPRTRRARKITDVA